MSDPEEVPKRRITIVEPNEVDENIPAPEQENDKQILAPKKEEVKSVIAPKKEKDELMQKDDISELQQAENEKKKAEEKHPLEKETRNEKIEVIEKPRIKSEESEYFDITEVGEDMLRNLSTTLVDVSLSSFEIGICMDTEESSSSVGSYVEQKPLEDEKDFFEVFQEVPEIEEFEATFQKDIDESNQDRGSFYDPLTGVLTLSDKSLEVEESSESEKESEPEKDSELEEDDDLLIFEERDAKEEETVTPVVIEEVEEMLDIFTDMQRQDAQEEIIDTKKLEQEMLARSIQHFCREFLGTLINKVVEFAEYVDPSTYLRSMLDKKKIFLLFKQKMNEIEYERSRKRFLEKKASDYFRHRKLYHNIIPGSQEYEAADIKRYKESLVKLERIICSHEKVTEKTKLKIIELENMKSELNVRATEEFNKLADLIQQTFIRKSNWGLMKEKIDKDISRMKQLRDDILEVRLKLIDKQHTLAKISREIETLETIDENLNLKMQDFENLQTEIISLDKKIEERNLDIRKCRSRWSSDLHTLAHIRDKIHMMRSEQVVQKQKFTEICNEKNRKREKLYFLKIQGIQIRKDIKELSVQCGLSDKPALLHDYDKTIDDIQILQTKIDEMKQKYTTTQNKLERLRAKCGLSSSIEVA